MTFSLVHSPGMNGGRETRWQQRWRRRWRWRRQRLQWHKLENGWKAKGTGKEEEKKVLMKKGSFHFILFSVQIISQIATISSNISTTKNLFSSFFLSTLALAVFPFPFSFFFIFSFFFVQQDYNVTLWRICVSVTNNSILTPFFSFHRNRNDYYF